MPTKPPRPLPTAEKDKEFCFVLFETKELLKQMHAQYTEPTPGRKPRQGGLQFSSVTHSCLTLCDPMNHSTPGLPVHHQLPEITQTRIHRVSDAIQPISSSVVPFSSCPQFLPASKSFPMSQLFASGGQSTGASALASFLPKKSQG